MRFTKLAVCILVLAVGARGEDPDRGRHTITATVSSEWRGLDSTGPEIRQLPEWTIATVAGIGSDDAAIGALYRIMRWLSGARLPLVGRPFAVFEDDPAVTVPESLHYVAAVPVPERATAGPETGITVRKWGGFQVAVMAYVGARSGLEPVRSGLRAWIEDNDWEPAGGLTEFYFDLPGQVPDDSLRVEVAYPVRRPDRR